MLKAAALVVLLAAHFITGCVATKGKASAFIPGDPNAPSQVKPSEALAIAQKFSSHSWRPFARNILHGADPAGVVVDTPDIGYKSPMHRPGWWIPGEANQGIPYKWGGFDDPTTFDQSIGAGNAAGDVSTPAKRQADNAAVSANAAGVDCSGFVSRCLKLPQVYDTTQLPSVCRPLSSGQDLRPGDLLNIPRGHVLLCAGWVKLDRSWVYYYETGGAPDYWKPGLKQAPLESLLALGYQPLRYRGMAHEPPPSGKETLTRAIRAHAAVITNPTIGEP